MAAQTVVVSWDSTSGFSFEQGGQPLPGGNVTVNTAGTNEVSFVRKSGQSWTFESFSLSVAVQADDKGGSDVVTVGRAYGDTFAWNVIENEVIISDGNQVPAGAVHEYKYSFAIWTGPEFGSVDCDPKIYNRIQ